MIILFVFKQYNILYWHLCWIPINIYFCHYITWSVLNLKILERLWYSGIFFHSIKPRHRDKMVGLGLFIFIVFFQPFSAISDYLTYWRGRHGQWYRTERWNYHRYASGKLDTRTHVRDETYDHPPYIPVWVIGSVIGWECLSGHNTERQYIDHNGCHTCRVPRSCKLKTYVQILNKIMCTAIATKE
jgi:hypothetical protein